MSDVIRIKVQLENMQRDIEFLKKHMVDIDSIMTEEDYIDLKNYRKEKKEDNLASHEDLKKELGL